MSAPSVLYDAPGPKAKARNVVYTIIFAVVLLAVLYWIFVQLGAKDQLRPELWTPFFTEGTVWTTFLLPGLLNTLKAAALALLIALPIGALFGILRLSDHVWIRVPAATVVEFFRAIPVLLLMVFANEFYAAFTDVDRADRPLFAVVTGLVLYNASVLAEVVRAGILSLPKGQTEASMALGMRKTQTMRMILLPQAVTLMLPAIVSQVAVIVKDTALGGAVLSFSDLMRQFRILPNEYNNNVLQTMIVIALIYIALNSLLSWVALLLEKRMSRRSRPPRGVKADHLEQPTGPDPMAATGLRTGDGGAGG
ncbi:MULTISPECIES: amino acid ABC transporter permease [unclassified Crossiella]|uniref:amino acid ABC transporter permease n=1 Tax=unclassified Crossiella TaxID=2620835 RepID=UPI001FFEB270|nr:MULTISPECIES: amino acid ABC transporter permease [unclassified Crossiella]MCK2240231.1 amino acid ABC transporter permease [Crossiella sp. S99.2]MCK2253317.1 amino acid ABC transporter permease [Crossiella sp. S99.1]